MGLHFLDYLSHFCILLLADTLLDKPQVPNNLPAVFLFLEKIDVPASSLGCLSKYSFKEDISDCQPN